MSSTIAGRLGRTEFIVLVAALIAINAFAIDIMLPGLQQIGASLGETDENRRQLVIPAYMMGFGIFQVLFGPLSDRFGRRNPLLVGLGIYVLAAASCYFVPTFDWLIAMRFAQGAGAAASAVIAMALVRDLFQGNEMAKTMSLVFMVLMLSPILAPGLGQLLLTLMDWRGLFFFMMAVGAAVAVWVWFRLPETLKPENRRPFTPGSIVEGFGIVFSNRTSLACIIATALLFGALMSFLNSSQQIYVGIYGAGVMFPAYFAAGAAFSALGGFLNSKLVTRLGMRRIAYAALTAFMLLSMLMLLLALAGWLSLLLFFVLCSLLFMSFSLTFPNLGSMAMEPLGEVAGTAASAQGAMQMVLGAAIGTFVGQAFDGTVVPLSAGFVGLSLAAALCVFATDRAVLRA